MKKFLSLLLCLLFLPCVFLGCKKTDPNRIRVNEVTHSIFYAPLYLAINNGYFADEGLTIEITNGGGADKVMTALTSNSADVGLMGPEATIYVNQQGRKDYPIIFGQLTNKDGSFLVGHAQEPDFTWESLRGKRVLAGRPGGVPAMTLQYVVNNKGMTSPADVNLDTTVAFDLMSAVFDSDPTVHYTTMFEPGASAYEAAGKGYIVASVGAEAGEVPYTAFAANKSYIDTHELQVKKFLKAIVKGYDYLMSASLDDVAQAIQPSFATNTVAEIKAGLSSYMEIQAWATTPVLNKTSFDRLQDIMQNAGTLDTRADYDKMVDNTFALAVMQELGKA